MKFLFDLFPVILFVVTYKIGDLNHETAAALANQYFSWLASSGVIEVKTAPTMWATLLTIVGTFGQVVWLKARGRHVDRMLLATLAIIVVLGGATIWLQNETFIKMKPTVLYWLLAAGFVVAEFAFHKNPARAMLDKVMRLPEPLWRNLLWWWIAFFVVLGALNLYVAFNFPMGVWVDFKVFGFYGISFVFIFAQVLLLSKYIVLEEPEMKKLAKQNAVPGDEASR
jgi:intracellular septation protein